MTATSDTNYQSVMDMATDVRNRVNAMQAKAVQSIADDTAGDMEDVKLVTAFHTSVTKSLDDLSKFIDQRQRQARKRSK